MSFLTYKDVRPWAKAIKAAVVARKMPPWFADPKIGQFTNDRSLKRSEIDTLVAWVDGGALEGNLKDAPPPKQWPADGWEVQPDIILDGPDFDVPASGVIDWFWVAIPSNFTKDTWITSMGCVANSRIKQRLNKMYFVKPAIHAASSDVAAP